ncbi:MAG: nucleotidyltransferase [Bacteroidetes bacterium]|nr:MAG: nucleotidyltransferase [Bacteroidota bacterium]
MTIQDLQDQQLILLECVAGSHSYGLAVPESDTDIRGIFIMPREGFFGLEYVPQVANETNDIVYYELGRYMELLLKNNPTILELLYAPEDCIRIQHPCIKQIQAFPFLSKLCEQSFAGYAFTQIQKARGLNKKIHNPVNEQRKNITDFCYVTVGYQSIPLQNWLDHYGYVQEKCGLVRLSNMREVYALFYDAEQTKGYRGISQGFESNEVSLSSVEKGETPLVYLSFNKDGYSSYCREYREYWEWVGKRNDARYQNTLSHGKNYDSKNMMHTFRLLDMAEEIATQKKVIVRRPNRDYLLKIRKGEFEYQDLVDIAEQRATRLADLYAQSGLPTEPDKSTAEKLLVDLRTAFYVGSKNLPTFAL